jgi:hypothetical protein
MDQVTARTLTDRHGIFGCHCGSRWRRGARLKQRRDECIYSSILINRIGSLRENGLFWYMSITTRARRSQSQNFAKANCFDSYLSFIVAVISHLANDSDRSATRRASCTALQNQRLQIWMCVKSGRSWDRARAQQFKRIEGFATWKKYWSQPHTCYR